MTPGLKKQKARISKPPSNNQRYENLKTNSKLLKSAKEKAHLIVLSLLEEEISCQYLEENIPFITSENFEDVAIERAIIGICGYPLCDSSLNSENMNNQTYVIRHNKVYDVTQRRNFCNNKCYEAWEIVHRQIPTIPLYLRETDKEVQNLKLVIPESSHLAGKIGKRVNITGAFDPEIDLITSADEAADKGEENQASSSPCQESEGISTGAFDPEFDLITSVDEAAADKGEESQASSSPCHESEEISTGAFDPEFDLITSVDEAAADKGEESQASSSPCHESEEISTDENSLEADSDDRSKDEVQKLSIKGKKIQKTAQGSLFKRKLEEKNRSSAGFENENQTSSKLADILEIEDTLREWMTLESLRFILGDLYVKGMLEHVGKIWDHYASKEPDSLSSVDLRIKYIAMCKKLDNEEMMERLQDAEDLAEEAKTFITESNPVPDYEKLKQDVEQLSLKVSAFYEGAEEYVIRENLETILEEEEEYDKICRVKRKANADAAEAVDSDSVTLPFIDTYSQKSWRRQIVLEKLNKSLSEYSVDFDLDGREVRRLARELTATFHLSSHDISFKTSQWRFIALIIIKMLSVRYPPITKAFNPGEKSYNLVASLLRGRGLDGDYLDRLLSYLTDISNILTKMDQKLNLNHENIVPGSCAEPGSRPDLDRRNETEKISTNFEELD